MSLTLYHYTCHHARLKLGHAGVLKPARQPQLANAKLVWLTDLDTPVVGALGLESTILRCDRTAHRYRVPPADVRKATPWHTWARRNGVAWRLREALKIGRSPMHWWVSETPTAVVYDPIGGTPADDRADLDDARRT